jgi:hypothetical protein
MLHCSERGKLLSIETVRKGTKEEMAFQWGIEE